jgi:hypothetical protein
MGEMKIDLIPREKPIKKYSYKLAHKYNPIIQKEIDGMLATDIIYLIKKLEWEIFMVVHPNKNEPKKIRICINFGGINKLALTYSFPTPFADEIMNKDARYECYSFTDRFSGYNQVPIAKEYQPKTTFVSEFGSFSYRVMSFGLKNASVVFSRIVVK